MARVAIITQDFVGESMAGPAIRAWEFARVLSKDHDVTLITHNETTLCAPLNAPFKILSIYTISKNTYFQNLDLIITQFVTAGVAYYAKKYGLKIVVDAYCPTVLEGYEIFKNLPRRIQKYESEKQASAQRFTFQFADYIICASDKQRDLWLGFLISNYLIDPSLYQEDPSLRNYIDIVPFGLDSKKIPEKSGPGPRELFGLKASDKIVLWGGSISNWFDPLTLVKAFALLAESRPEIKLVFMGTVHPNPNVPKMEIGEKAMQLARELGILNRSVFFNQKWYPYKERHNFLNEASIGISIHPCHLETRFSFRTRIVDYIWASLPIITTEGDVFAELVKSHQLGLVVPYQDQKAIANSIIQILDNPSLADQYRFNLVSLQDDFSWEKILEPLLIRIPILVQQKQQQKEKDQMSFSTRYLIAINFFNRFTQSIKVYGIFHTFRTVVSKVSKRILNKTIGFKRQNT